MLFKHVFLKKAIFPVFLIFPVKTSFLEFPGLFPNPVLQTLKYRYFVGKSTKSLDKVHNLTINMTIFQKIGPLVDLGWPWQIQTEEIKTKKKKNKLKVKVQAKIHKFPAPPII